VAKCTNNVTNLPAAIADLRQMSFGYPDICRRHSRKALEKPNFLPGFIPDNARQAILVYNLGHCFYN
jgi:hypothetical protein